MDTRFNVNEARIADFIRPLRHRIASILRDTKNEVNVVMLPVLRDIEASARFFPIYLIADDKPLQVLMRRVDVYVVAARPDSDGEPWLILSEKDDAHLETFNFLNDGCKVPDGDGGFIEPIITPIRADYVSLEGNSQLRVDIKLGRQELIQAVYSLLKGTKILNNVAVLSKSFIVLSESIGEALRFHSLCDFIDGRFVMGSGALPEKHLVDQQSEWGKFSEHLVKYAYEANGSNPLVMVGGKQVSTEDAKAIVALIKGVDIEELCADSAAKDVKIKKR